MASRRRARSRAFRRSRTRTRSASTPPPDGCSSQASVGRRGTDRSTGLIGTWARRRLRVMAVDARSPATGMPITTSIRWSSTGAEQEAAGVKAVMVSLQRGLTSMGAVPHRGVAGPAEPAQGLRLPRLRVARGARRPQVRRVLRERRQGRRRGGHQTRRHPRLLRPALGRRSGRADPSTGCRQQGRLTHPMVLRPGDDHYQPIELGRRLPADRRRPARAGQPRTRRCSTPRGAPATRPRSSTNCWSAASAPTTCPTARTCATSRRAPR